jgi:N-acetylmuramoyl-L-alanine amidase
MNVLTCVAAPARRCTISVLALIAVLSSPPDLRAGATLVIDPGHGGADGGAVSDGGYTESAINLDIALRLRAIAGFLGMRTAMTRESEHIEYTDNATTARKMKLEDMKNRLAVIRGASDPVFVSIHQNKFGSPSPSGAQVIFAAGEESRAMGETVQNALFGVLGRGNRRAAVLDSGDLYLLNNAGCPAVLIECGFLSNPREEALLGTGSYRLKVAVAIAAGLRQAMCAGAEAGEERPF